MRTYVTVFSRSLTSYSYMVGIIMKKLFSKMNRSYTNHCGKPIGGDGGHCG